MTPRTKVATQRTKPAAAGPRSYYGLIGLALILAAMVVVYWPAVHGGLLVDDDGNITRPILQPLSGLNLIWFHPSVTAQYYPLLHTFFWIEHRLWGDEVLGYHLVTLLWHGVNVTLLYLIIGRLKISGALLAAAIFALHPVMVESVAWMCEQKNTLSTLFYLGAMLAYVDFDASRRLARYFLSLALFTAALLAKTITVTLPVALLIILWWQRGNLSWKRDIVPLVPCFVLGIALGLTTVVVEHSYFHGEEADFTLTLAQRFLLAGRAIWFYLSKLVWPANLYFTYPRWTLDSTQWWQWLYPIAALATTVTLWSIRLRWRAPLAAWLFFCGTLFPGIGFANVYMFTITFVADHFQYLASLGIFVFAAATASQSFARWSLTNRWIGAAACVPLIGTLAFLSLQQSRLYGNVEKFYRSLLAENPESWLAHNNLGYELYHQNKLDEALQQYRQAIRIRPNFEIAHRNVGWVLGDLGRPSESLAEYRAALALEPNDPQALTGFGFALIETNRSAEAIEPLQRAVKLEPEYALAHNRLGIALARRGNTSQAIDEFRRALEIDPKYADAHNNWGFALSNLGQKQPAIEQFRQALQINPGDAHAHFNLASLLNETGQMAEAISQFEQAIHVKPDFAEAHLELGEILNQTNSNQAIIHYQVALELKPTLVNAYANLAKALASAGRGGEAIAAARQGIEANRAAGQNAAADRIQQWLASYQIERERNRGTK
jgi:Tfp pilus assembly protein PilF